MFKSIVTSKKFLIVFSVISLLTLAISFVKPRVSLPLIFTTLPINNASMVPVIAPIEYVFEKPITASDFSIKSTPAMDWTITQKDSSTLIVTHKAPMKRSIKYIVNLSWKNTQINELIFTTQDTETDYVLIDKLKNEVARDYPLSKLTPYEGLGFTVVYSAPLTLQITLINPSLTENEVVEEVRVWVTKNGGNATAHKYIVVQPSPSPVNE